MVNPKLTYAQALDISNDIMASGNSQKRIIVLAGAVQLSFLMMLKREQIITLNRGDFSGPYYHQDNYDRSYRSRNIRISSQTVHTAEMLCYLNGVRNWPLNKYSSRRCLDILRSTRRGYEFYNEEDYKAPWQKYYERLSQVFGTNHNEPLFPYENGGQYIASTLRRQLKTHTNYTWNDFRTSGLFHYYHRLRIQKYEPQNAVAALAKLTNLTESYLKGLFMGHYGV